MRSHRRPVTMVLDAAAVAVFVAVGRAAHRHGVTAAGLATTAWPFAVGLLVGWLAASRTGGSDGIAGRRGWAVITVTTVAVGMLLRVVAGQGTAVSFTIVALVFLGSCFGAARVVSLVAGRGPSARAAGRRGRPAAR